MFDGPLLAQVVQRRRRRLRHVRRAVSWLLLTGWIVLPMLPLLGLGLSFLLGLEMF